MERASYNKEKQVVNVDIEEVPLSKNLARTQTPAFPIPSLRHIIFMNVTRAIHNYTSVSRSTHTSNVALNRCLDEELGLVVSHKVCWQPVLLHLGEKEVQQLALIAVRG